MLITSKEFNDAFEAEIEKIVNEKISDYVETEDFLSIIDKEVQKELDGVMAILKIDLEEKSDDHLHVLLFTSRADEAERAIDFEEVISLEAEQRSIENLYYLLSRLKRCEDIVRTAIEGF